MAIDIAARPHAAEARADDYPAWLGEDAVHDMAELLRPYPSEEMRAYRVSTAVNNVKKYGPECIETAA